VEVVEGVPSSVSVSGLDFHLRDRALVDLIAAVEIAVVADAAGKRRSQQREGRERYALARARRASILQRIHSHPPLAGAATPVGREA